VTFPKRYKKSDTSKPVLAENFRIIPTRSHTIKHYTSKYN